MDKIVGSAQRRTPNAVLQHGSIVLGNRFEQQLTAQVDRPFDQTAEELRRLLMDEFQSVMNHQLEPGEWSNDEQVAAHELHDKYSGPTWTRRPCHSQRTTVLKNAWHRLPAVAPSAIP